MNNRESRLTIGEELSCYAIAIAQVAAAIICAGIILAAFIAVLWLASGQSYRL